MKPPVLRPAAAADVEEAYRWYEAQREGLGREFLQVVGAALAELRQRPLSAPLVHQGIRRLLLRRFPYGLFYKLIRGQVVVLACFHAKRNPHRWPSRG